MPSTLVITLVGPDRPGIISELAQLAASHEANWLESHMANLAGQFAGIVQVEVADERVKALRQALTSAQHDGLQLLVHEAGVASAGSGPTRRVELTLTGQDHPGIVSEISAALAEHGVSIESLETASRDAAMAGGRLFEANAVLILPLELDDNALDTMMEALSNSLLVDIELDDGAVVA